MITKDYVRGFVDGEGGFNNAAIQMYNTDKEIMYKIGEFLIDSGYTVRGLNKPSKGTNLPCYRIALSGIEDLSKYATEIGFGIESKQNALEKYIKKLCEYGKANNLCEYYVYIKCTEAGYGVTKTAREMGIYLSVLQYRIKNIYPFSDEIIARLTPFQPTNFRNSSLIAQK